jgi:hypothetical protein
MKQEELYKTSDLAIASFLSLYFSVWAIEKDNTNKAEFLFKREQGLDDIIESFWRGEARVNPLAYFNALKLIKSRLYEKQ